MCVTQRERKETEGENRKKHTERECVCVCGVGVELNRKGEEIEGREWTQREGETEMKNSQIDWKTFSPSLVSK